jgi:predicted DNA-binding antitoxin AbrB/MazE fold protein
MVRELDAVFEAGVLRPLEPLALSEQQLVRVTVDDLQSSKESGGAPRKNDPGTDRRIDRTQEMLWLANEAKPSAGEWVALIGSRLLAHGPDAVEVREKARAAGVERPLLSHLPPAGEDSFGGW